MPKSYTQGKSAIIKWIGSNFNINSKILDIGPGVGTYSDYLKPLGYTFIDCLEIYEPYIEKYELEKKYNKVFCDDITKFEIKKGDYDLFIFGDVLEHLSIMDAKSVLEIIVNMKNGIVISVPFMYQQGSWGGNKYETHLQPDLNITTMQERYPYLSLLTIDGVMGIYYYISK